MVISMYVIAPRWQAKEAAGFLISIFSKKRLWLKRRRFKNFKILRILSPKNTFCFS